MQLINAIRILPQPDDITCGPTSLHAVYRYYGLNLELREVIESVAFLQSGGTLAVMLGIDALKRGFNATIYSYNLKMFDPTWCNSGNLELTDLLEKQIQYKTGKRFLHATRAYQTFLRLGGTIRFEDLNQNILEKYFDREIPVLTGLSSTYLYNTRREYTNRNNVSVFDDIRGEPTGHFVVLCGMENQTVHVADPFLENPISGKNHYEVDINRLFHSILLGIMTYDVNMLMIMAK